MRASTPQDFKVFSTPQLLSCQRNLWCQLKLHRMQHSAACGGDVSRHSCLLFGGLVGSDSVVVLGRVGQAGEHELPRNILIPTRKFTISVCGNGQNTLPAPRTEQKSDHLIQLKIHKGSQITSSVHPSGACEGFLCAGVHPKTSLMNGWPPFV